MKKKEEKRGMEAVLAKVGKRKPALKRKGPGLAIMIAVGKPKPEKGKLMGDDRGFSPDEAVGAGKIAQLEKRIAELEAELAMLKGEDEKDTEDDTEEEEY